MKIRLISQSKFTWEDNLLFILVPWWARKMRILSHDLYHGLSISLWVLPITCYLQSLPHPSRPTPTKSALSESLLCFYWHRVSSIKVNPALLQRSTFCLPTVQKRKQTDFLQAGGNMREKLRRVIRWIQSWMWGNRVQLNPPETMIRRTESTRLSK